MAPAREFDIEEVFVRYKRRISDLGKPEVCWLWTGRTCNWGYGIGSWNQKRIVIHRLSYEWFKGPIPEGLVIDHLCGNRLCQNPDHMEAVTLGENVRRGQLRRWDEYRASPSYRQFEPGSTCKRGHLWTEHGRWQKSKLGFQRVCRRCAVLYQQEYQARKRASALQQEVE